MRHQMKKITLGRKTVARRSLMANLAESVILYEKVRTTKAKAKAVQSVVEKLITKAKLNTLAARRDIMKTLYTENAVKKLMEQLGKKYADRKGGFTRVTVVKNRVGDGAEEAIIEFV